MTDLSTQLSDLANKVCELEVTEGALRRAIMDALGKDRCICDMRINHPQVTSHSLQCKVLRSAIGIREKSMFEPEPKKEPLFSGKCENGCSDMYLQQMMTPGSVIWCCMKCGESHRVLR